MRAFRKLLRMPHRDRMLLLRALALVVTARAGTWLLPFRVVRRAEARLAHVAAGRKRDFAPERAAWAVMAAGRRMPGGNNCLVQALATDVLLQRAGYASEICIGVARGTESPIDAHAWVECEGEVVVGGDERLHTFKRLPALGNIR